MAMVSSSVAVLVVVLFCSITNVASLKRSTDNHRVSRALIDWNQQHDNEDDFADPFLPRLDHNIQSPRPHLSLSGEEEVGDIWNRRTGLLQDVRRNMAVGRNVFPDNDDEMLPDTPISSTLQQSFLKTGTTIVGVATDTCVILASDTRATAGTLVADPTTHKLHALSSHAAAAGAGTAADLEHITKACATAGKLYVITNCAWGNTNVDDAVPFSFLCHYLQSTLYQQGGNCQAHLIVGGFDDNSHAPRLHNFHPHGSMDTVAYTSLGSGSMAALAVLEDMYQPNMSLEDAVDLAVTAVKAGIVHDMGSGSCVDVCILRLDRPAEYVRSVVEEETLPTMMTNEEQGEAVDQPLAFLSAAGVNGFGNMDYTIQSKRKFCAATIEKEQLDAWSDILPPSS